MTRVVAAGCAGLLAATSCSSSTQKTVKEVAETVLTLQSGTVSELKTRRGTGPFTEHPVPPVEMMDLVTQVLKTKVVAVFPEKDQRVVVAKERAGKDADDDSYSPAFRSAVAVFVHPVTGDPSRSQVEIHAIQRGPFHRGSIAWESELPPLIDAAVARRSAPIRRLR